MLLAVQQRWPASREANLITVRTLAAPSNRGSTTRRHYRSRKGAAAFSDACSAAVNHAWLYRGCLAPHRVRFIFSNRIPSDGHPKTRVCLVVDIRLPNGLAIREKSDSTPPYRPLRMSTHS